MNAIINNPYRTLRLFGNSTEKELQKQITLLKRFAEFGTNRTRLTHMLVLYQPELSTG